MGGSSRGTRGMGGAVVGEVSAAVSLLLLVLSDDLDFGYGAYLPHVTWHVKSTSFSSSGKFLSLSLLFVRLLVVGMVVSVEGLPSSGSILDFFAAGSFSDIRVSTAAAPAVAVANATGVSFRLLVSIISSSSLSCSVSSPSS